MSFRNRKNEAGQAVLIVLLSLSVVLVIVLYIMSRSISDISLSSKDQDSMRAFSAAEAGIEKALVGLYTVGSSSGVTPIGDATFNASVTSFGSGQNQIVYPLALKSGDQAVFWFNRPGDPTNFTGSQFKLCWGASGTSAVLDTPAVLVTIYYRTTLGRYRVARVALDPNAGRAVNNRFSASSTICTIGSDTFQFQSTINLAAGGLNIPNYGTAGVLQFATVRFLYNTTTGHKVGVDSSATAALFPSQGIKVDSQGTSADANRRIEVYQLNSEVPPIFANAIYSTSDIIK